MAVTLIFVGITAGAVLFMIRFLIAICSQECKAVRVVHVAPTAAENGGSDDGGEEQEGQILALGCDGVLVQQERTGRKESMPHAWRN